MLIGRALGTRFWTRRCLRVSFRHAKAFHGTAWQLQAEIIDGKSLAQKIRKSLSHEIDTLKTASPSFHPRVAIVQVGGREDSNVYVRMKQKAAQEIGVGFVHCHFPETVSEEELLQSVQGLNDDPSIHGILVQLPLPKGLNERLVSESIVPEKDVDGFNEVNMGRLSKNTAKPIHSACTPKGVMELLQYYNIPIAGRHAVVLGRSDIVGNPVSYLLRKANATVTVCHSYTQDLPKYVGEADIVVAALGKPEFVRGEWLKPGATVIDVGINSVQDGARRKLVGDVHFESAKKVAGFITPVPGSVGPMTVAMLMSNIVDAAKLAYAKSRAIPKVELLPLELKTPVPSDIEIAKTQTPKEICRLAEDIGILPSEIEPFGPYKAKVSLDVLDRTVDRPNGHYVLVSGITPTPFGEGKSTVLIGMAQALGNLDKLSIACVRQPSQGPTFGVKGGAAGGGYAQIIPMDEFNLHLTGDIHAVTAANNLMAAALETRMFHEDTQTNEALLRRLIPVKNGKRVLHKGMKARWEAICAKHEYDSSKLDEAPKELLYELTRLDIDPSTITVNRVLDVNDRFLRGVEVGKAPTEKGHVREAAFDISVASECMSVLALANDLPDLRRRLGRIVVANNKAGEPITAEDLGVAGAMAVLMKDAVKPNLMQTLEGTPVMVHAGPFANISIGASSVLADRIALKLASGGSNGEPGYVLTEAGFASDIGMEKFFNIKCRSSGLVPNAVVLVATVRALKLHGGGPDVSPGKALPEQYTTEDVELVRRGCANMAKHIENCKKFNVPVVVAVNKYITDTDAELDVIREEAIKAGALDAVTSEHWAKGGQGAIPLARAVMNACEKSKNQKFKFLYDVNLTISQKIEKIAVEMYGASGIELSPLAREKMERFIEQGFGHLPVCMAKTQYSLSHDPKLKNVPKDFVIPIRDMRLSAGAGFIYPLVAEIMTIPGLPTAPSYLNIDINDKGEVFGLF
ncbi:C-1-tetrahydrofolate synthase [Schizosaccharomyces japonicus yFS275]|uniref:C-1-tetrahydrofolate synthase, cytoplasmic n=1 Tax=Schizosaccharomyces japonicus (strain yFS275 / FY16936) TaxID=402676 RepID=B6JXG7_SCHJY|nr:C-1-tetrahydrofolate synthase [Schizosaccharomyces japonicus yFS275]EEB05111.1 C-1-tetrahydrofolate synthase [Schizosaccharomyces japonicus yFS275]